MSSLFEWVPVRDDHGQLLGMKCPQCGRRVKNKGENYCPKCGSKMKMPPMAKIDPPKELEMEFKAVGVKYSEDNSLPVGLILDNGFTIGFADKNGDPLPLNREAIDKWFQK